jgi:hypothetical protein
MSVAKNRACELSSAKFSIGMLLPRRQKKMAVSFETAIFFVINSYLESLLLDTCFFTGQFTEVEDTCSSDATVLVDVNFLNKW